MHLNYSLLNYSHLNNANICSNIYKYIFSSFVNICHSCKFANRDFRDLFYKNFEY